MTISIFKNDKIDRIEIELYVMRDVTSSRRDDYPLRYVVEGRLITGKRDTVIFMKPYSSEDRAIDEYNKLTRIFRSEG